MRKMMVIRYGWESNNRAGRKKALFGEKPTLYQLSDTTLRVREYQKVLTISLDVKSVWFAVGEFLDALKCCGDIKNYGWQSPVP